MALAVAALRAKLTPVDRSIVAEAAGVAVQVLRALRYGNPELKRYYAETLAPVVGVSVGDRPGAAEPPEHAA